MAILHAMVLTAAAAVPVREPMPHPAGPYLSPYTLDGELAGWVDEVIGRSSYDISGLASQLVGSVAQAYGADSGRLGGVLQHAARSGGVSTRELGSALAVVGGHSGPGDRSSGLDLATAALTELARHGLAGEHGGRSLRRILEAIDDPQSALVSELERKGIRVSGLSDLVGGLEQLPEDEAEQVYDTLDVEVAPALRTLTRSGRSGLETRMDELQRQHAPGASASVEAVLARGDDSGLAGVGDFLQQKLTDRALRQGGGLGAGFMGLVGAMAETHRTLDVTPGMMDRLRTQADSSFDQLDDLLVYTMVHHRSRGDFARASEAMMILYPQARPRMQAAHEVASELIIAEWHRMQQRMELQWETDGG